MENTNPLTSRQRMVLNTSQRMTTRRGFGPTIREIAEAMDINSPNGVVVHLRALEKKGFIRRNANLSHSIQLVERKPTKRQKGLPLVGQVAAGPLTEAVEQAERLDLAKLFDKSENFMLEVRGDSMIEAHICDGDYVVVSKQLTAEAGQIVVARTPDGEATIKYYYPERKRVRLLPANRKMQAILVDEVEILGVVIGVVRQIDD